MYDVTTPTGSINPFVYHFSTHFAMPATRSPTRARSKRTTTQCTPTKRAVLVALHDHCKYSFAKITTISPFKHTTLNRRMLERNYNEVKAHGGDLYFNNRKGRAGRPKAISDRDLAEAVRRIDAGEFVDGEDVRREMLPDVPGRTVRDTSRRIFLPNDAMITRSGPHFQVRGCADTSSV
jgi:hypothetical protein